MEAINGWNIIDQSTAIGQVSLMGADILITVRWKDETYDPVEDLQEMMDAQGSQDSVDHIRTFGNKDRPAYYAMFHVNGQPAGTISLRLGPEPTIEDMARNEAPEGLWDVFQNIVRQ